MKQPSDLSEDELRWYLGAACGELAQAICDLRPGWEAVVRYPDREAGTEEWRGLPWGDVLPSHHVAARTPEGRVLDVRGWRDDPAWAAADVYTVRFQLSDEDYELARRLLLALEV